jgi:FtsP/CotA-like multicopper oxidase with cupredoxin domain
MTVAVVALAYISMYPLSGSNTRTLTEGNACTVYRTAYVVIANERGYNDSIDHGTPQNYWPVLCVHPGQQVTIKVKNTGTEPHGFSIGRYFEAGESIPQGQSFTFNFVADRSGSFLIYCTILCAVHPWMQDGLLVVN